MITDEERQIADAEWEGMPAPVTEGERLTFVWRMPPRLVSLEDIVRWNAAARAVLLEGGSSGFTEPWYFNHPTVVPND